jgi:hypothetical protein
MVLRRRRSHAFRPRDLSQTVVGLGSVAVGLATLLVLPRTLPAGGDRLWSWLWIIAAACFLGGTLVLAPVVRRVVLLIFVLAGVAAAGVGLVRVGVETLAEQERETTRIAAALLRYRLPELPATDDVATVADSTVETPAGAQPLPTDPDTDGPTGASTTGAGSAAAGDDGGDLTPSAVEQVDQLCAAAGGRMTGPPWRCPPADPQTGLSRSLVISQVYSGGEQADAASSRAFVEVFNRGDVPASLAELSIQYVSTTKTDNLGVSDPQPSELPDVSLAPGQYYVVQPAGDSSAVPLPSSDLAADTPISISPSGGTVVLAEGTAPLGCSGGDPPCAAEQLARILDLVGYGDADFFEGSAAAPALTATTALLRADDGRIDTDDNAADFTSQPPLQRTATSGDTSWWSRVASDLGRSLLPDGRQGVVGPAVTTQQLVAARARAELAVSEIELTAALGTDEEEVRRAAVVVAREADQAAEPDRVNVTAAVTVGANTIIDELLPLNQRVPLAIGAAGWLLFAAVGLGIVRWLSARNSTRELGPVTLEPIDENGALWKKRSEEFRCYLLENVPEPGTAPDADTLIQVANLIGSVIPAETPVGNALTAIRTAVTVTPGYTVEFGQLPPTDTQPPANQPQESDKQSPPQLLVRIRKTRTHRLLTQRGFPIAQPEQEGLVIREAAYWAAGVIIDACPGVPHWARWSPDPRIVEALAEYEHSRGPELDRDDEDRHASGETDALERASQLSPATGTLLLRAAHTRELEGNFVGALTLTLEAVTLHPRYLNARYRLATEASLLVSHLNDLSRSKAPKVRNPEPALNFGELKRCHTAAARYLGSRHKLTLALEKCLWEPIEREPTQSVGSAPNDDYTNLLGSYDRIGLGERLEREPVLDRLKHELLRFSRTERRNTRWLLSPPVLLANSLHASERDLWLPLLLHRRRRTDRQQRLTSAQLATYRLLLDDERIPLNWLDFHLVSSILRLRIRTLSPAARRGDALWQLPYNLACYHALSAAASRQKDLEKAKRDLKKAEKNLDKARQEDLRNAWGMLECVRVARGRHQLTAGWLNSDPDLSALQEDKNRWDSYLEHWPTPSATRTVPVEGPPGHPGSPNGEHPSPRTDPSSQHDEPQRPDDEVSDRCRTSSSARRRIHSQRIGS